jgi:hypothetical protein
MSRGYAPAKRWTPFFIRISLSKMFKHTDSMRNRFTTLGVGTLAHYAT